ncbi:MAG: hypothetical protein JO302_05940 [Candidatus Eremiobacteraeota bacterium]|nr:hypothetical protein [Candidatus Eremiobacteraeota bacterium]
MLDPLLAAGRLPKLAERAMRDAILGGVAQARRLSHRVLVDDALLRFEGMVARAAPDGIRPAILFAERDRIVRDLGRFARSRLANRLFAIHRDDVAAIDDAARPFDAIVRGRRGGLYGVILRRLPSDGRRLESMRAMRGAATAYRQAHLLGVLVYDFATARVRTLRCGARPVELSAA